ncbi:MAG: cytochrome c [Acidobacteriota bacterium]|nr:cytochrome c [Acidobacteriota bacterium]
MNFLKIGLLLSALTLFIVACTQNNPGGNNANTAAANTANNRAAVVNTTPAASGANQTAENSGKQTATTAPASDATGLSSASETYKTICAKCHKETGEGGEMTVNGKKLKVPNFKTERMKNDSDEDFIDAIANGIPEDGMPAFKDRLNEEQIKALVQYIRTDIQGK